MDNLNKALLKLAIYVCMYTFMAFVLVATHITKHIRSYCNRLAGYGIKNEWIKNVNKMNYRGTALLLYSWLFSNQKFSYKCLKINFSGFIFEVSIF